MVQFSLSHSRDVSAPVYYTLSLHDALPISLARSHASNGEFDRALELLGQADDIMPAAAHLVFDSDRDRKSTRLNSSHVEISYAVFCVKKITITTGMRPNKYLDLKMKEIDWI